MIWILSWCSEVGFDVLGFLQCTIFRHVYLNQAVSTSRTERMGIEPPIDASDVYAMVALRQNFHTHATESGSLLYFRSFLVKLWPPIHISTE